MDRVEYEGYVIEARTCQLRDDGHWTVAIGIWRHSGSESIVREFSSASTFGTREEAVRHCFTFGRQIIDGEVPGCAAP